MRVKAVWLERDFMVLYFVLFLYGATIICIWRTLNAVFWIKSTALLSKFVGLSGWFGCDLSGVPLALDSTRELALWTIYPGARGLGYVIRMAGYQLSSLGQRRGLESSNIALIYLTLTQVVV